MVLSLFPDQRALLLSGTRTGSGGSRLPLPLPPQGGGSTPRHMGPRLARLEADVSHLRSDFADLKADCKAVVADVGTLGVDVARLDERVKNLPGKGFVITTTSTTIALIGGLILFADKLRALTAGWTAAARIVGVSPTWSGGEVPSFGPLDDRWRMIHPPRTSGYSDVGCHSSSNLRSYLSLRGPLTAMKFRINNV